MNKNTFEHKGFQTKLMSPQNKKKKKGNCSEKTMTCSFDPSSNRSVNP